MFLESCLLICEKHSILKGATMLKSRVNRSLALPTFQITLLSDVNDCKKSFIFLIICFGLLNICFKLLLFSNIFEQIKMYFLQTIVYNENK